MYYGYSTANDASSGTSTFQFFDDFEDGNITEYTGDTTLFVNSTSFNYERSYGLAAQTVTAQNTSGIAQISAGVGHIPRAVRSAIQAWSVGPASSSCTM